jgi:hypothetical protein
VTAPRDPWDRPHLFEYWDQRDNAIAQSAAALNELDDNGVRFALERLTAHVIELARVAPQTLLAQTAFVMTDDLYKAACATPSWDSALAGYLTASAGAFTTLLTERGLTVEYVVDNSFAPDNMQRPLTLFGPWFESAGFVYVCPQALAIELAEQTASSEEPAVDAHSLAEARDMATELVRRCRQERRHYMYLDVDFQIDSVDFLINVTSDVPGVISVFRNQPPLPGTEVEVRLPSNL